MIDFAGKAEYISILMPAFLQGAWVTTKLFALTLIFSLPLGLIFALGSIGRFLPVKWICKIYIWIFRGTPLILQLFFFYFFLPISMGIALSPFTTAVLTFVLNYAAYFAEIYRGGIESIEAGQYEAAKSLGLSRWQTMFGIIIPQTVKRIMPSISNEAIVLVKDTALAFTISIAELLKVANSAVNRDQDATAYLLAAGIYLLMTFVITLISDALERKYSFAGQSPTAKKEYKLLKLLGAREERGNNNG